MESHPLNQAHQQHRRAEAHLINNRYDEAMLCHHNAAELLLDAMKSTTSAVALESITLQHSYHLKQKDLIKSKKEQYSRVKKAMENLKWLAKDPNVNLNQQADKSKIQIAIYRALNESDSLLHMLSAKKDPMFMQGAGKDIRGDTTDGKIKKSPEVVAEELEVVNQSLRNLVEQLVTQVEVMKDENMTLKERVNYLEKERIKYLSIPTSNNDLVYKNSFAHFSMDNDSIKDPFAIPIVPMIPQTRPKLTNNSNQEPNFDLTALKDG